LNYFNHIQRQAAKALLTDPGWDGKTVVTVREREV
jgi:hypothetical protein